MERSPPDGSGDDMVSPQHRQADYELWADTMSPDLLALLSAEGLPVSEYGIVDLGVPAVARVYERALWITINLPLPDENVEVHDATLDLVEAHLGGRGPGASSSQGQFKCTFAVSEFDARTMTAVRAFGATVAQYLQIDVAPDVQRIDARELTESLLGSAATGRLVLL